MTRCRIEHHAKLESQLADIRKFVNEQADEKGLWFVPQTVTEDYLQRALRSLHEVVEGKTSVECAIAALHF